MTSPRKNLGPMHIVSIPSRRARLPPTEKRHTRLKVSNAGPAYEPVACLACLSVHLVDPETVRVLGIDNDE
jgi:hypothetical protein